MNWLFRLRRAFDPVIRKLGSPPSGRKLIAPVLILLIVGSAGYAGRLPSVLVYPAFGILFYLLIAFFMAVVYDANVRRPRIIVELNRTALVAPGSQAKRLLPKLPNAKVAFLFNRAQLTVIDKLVATAVQRDPSYRPPDFRRMVLVKLKVHADPIPILRLLSGATDTHGVNLAYLEQPVKPAASKPEDNPQFHDQRYLNAAPEGMDVRYAWTAPGGTGESMSFADVEAGWDFSSNDLTRNGQALITASSNSIDTGDHAHGAQVLGIVMAQNNNINAIGISPDLTQASAWGYRADNGDPELMHAISYAAASLNSGDVLCMPIETTGATPRFPVEATPVHFKAIRLATANGVIVVEAAGNGNQPLDQYQGDVSLNRNVNFKDSLAIVVGAADTSTIATRVTSTSLSPPPAGFDVHTRHRTSNFGNRIDVFGWGDQVVSILGGFFNGTSSATAMIAGAAMSIQGIVKRLGYPTLTPRQMRNLLCYQGTLPDPAANRPAIGVMPNLRRIVDYLENRPEVFIRDGEGDRGSPHELRDCFESPDIFIRAARVVAANINQTNEPALVAGQTESVYLRFGNSGRSAGAISVQLYEIPNTTIPLPGDFSAVGPPLTVNVPVEESPIAGPINWTPSAPAHGLLVTFDAPDNPALPPDYFQVRRNFGRILRTQTNVACRNFRTIQNKHTALKNHLTGLTSAVLLDFSAPVSEGDDTFSTGLVQLDIDHNLPRSASVWLEGPIDFMLKASSPQQQDPQTLLAWLELFGSLTLSEVACSPDLQALRFRLLIEINAADLQQTFRVQVRQLNGTEVIGHIGWNLVP